MSAAQVEKVYIDTMVFIYKLARTDHPLYSKANSFFSDVEKGRYVGIASTFTHAEYESVVKTLLSEARNTVPPQDDVGKAVGELDKFLVEMGIELYNADVVADQKPVTLFYRSEQLIKAAGAIRGRDGRWRTIGGADALSLALAEIVGANQFATFDQGFKGTTNSNVRPLLLSEAY